MDMIRAISANRLNPVIDRRFLLQDIVAAFKYFESQKHFGKVCLTLRSPLSTAGCGRR